MTDHSVELTGLSPDTTYRFRVTLGRRRRQLRHVARRRAAPASRRRPARSSTSRTSEFAAGTRRRHLRRRDASTAPTARSSSSRRSARSSRALAAGRLEHAVLGRRRQASRSAAARCVADGAVALHDRRFYDRPRTLEFAATFQPVNDQAVGLRRRPERLPVRGVHAPATPAMPVPASTPRAAPGRATSTITPLPGVSLHVPHRFRIEWTADDVALLRGRRAGGAPTPSRSTRPLRPVVSDYGLFGAGVQVALAAHGRLRRRPARSPRACSTAAPARATGRR